MRKLFRLIFAVKTYRRFEKVLDKIEKQAFEYCINPSTPLYKIRNIKKNFHKVSKLYVKFRNGEK